MRTIFGKKLISRSTGRLLGLYCLAFVAAANASVVTEDLKSEVIGRVTVRFHDLDLRQPADAAALYQRLRYAAREACQITGSRDLAARSEEYRCSKTALERAVRSIDKPQVTAAHERFMAKRGSKAA